MGWARVPPRPRSSACACPRAAALPGAREAPDSRPRPPAAAHTPRRQGGRARTHPALPGEDRAPCPARAGMAASRQGPASGQKACPGQPAGKPTPRRAGSSPSDSLRRPAAATASCTTLRSKGVMMPSRFGAPPGPAFSARALARPGRGRVRAAAVPHFLGGVLPQLGESRPAPTPVPPDIQHDPGPHAGLPVDRQPGQLLQCFEHLAARADQLLQRRPDHRDKRPVSFHVHVDVTVEVGHVEQALDVVRGDLALLLEIRGIHLRPRFGRALALVLAGHETFTIAGQIVRLYQLVGLYQIVRLKVLRLHQIVRPDGAVLRRSIPLDGVAVLLAAAGPTVPFSDAASPSMGSPSSSTPPASARFATSSLVTVGAFSPWLTTGSSLLRIRTVQAPCGSEVSSAASPLARTPTTRLAHWLLPDELSLGRGRLGVGPGVRAASAEPAQHAARTATVAAVCGRRLGSLRHCRSLRHRRSLGHDSARPGAARLLGRAPRRPP